MRREERGDGARAELHCRCAEGGRRVLRASLIVIGMSDSFVRASLSVLPPFTTDDSRGNTIRRLK